MSSSQAVAIRASLISVLTPMIAIIATLVLPFRAAAFVVGVTTGVYTVVAIGQVLDQARRDGRWSGRFRLLLVAPPAVVAGAIAASIVWLLRSAA